MCLSLSLYVEMIFSVAFYLAALSCCICSLLIHEFQNSVLTQNFDVSLE